MVPSPRTALSQDDSNLDQLIIENGVKLGHFQQLRTEVSLQVSGHVACVTRSAGRDSNYIRAQSEEAERDREEILQHLVYLKLPFKVRYTLTFQLLNEHLTSVFGVQ